MASSTTLSASHQWDARNASGAAALAAAAKKQMTIPTLMIGETFRGCFLTIDFGICRVADICCLPPVDLGEGLLLMALVDWTERRDIRRFYPCDKAD